MRFSPLFSTLVSVQWIHTQAWTTTAPALTRRTIHTTTSRSTGLSASIAPEEVDEEVDLSAFAKQDVGCTTIARGPIVSYFPGGLAAVKLEEEDFNASPPSKPEPMIQPMTAGKKQKDTGDDLIGRLAKLPNGSLGVVVAQRPPMAFVFSEEQPGDSVSEGTVEVMNAMAKVNVGDERIVNGFGQSASSSSVLSSIFAPIPKVADIALINSPLLTGTTMVDVLAPIGKGQNMLLVGSDVADLRDLACNFIQTQSKGKTRCIYAATSHSKEIMTTLEEAGVLQDATVVAAREDTLEGNTVAQAAEATLVAATACAIGESYAKNNGEDCLIIVDTLDHHKTLWDATTRVLVDIYGVDAVVAADREGGASSEMRAFYSSLIQRAANYKGDKGSVTIALMTSIPEEQDDENTVFTMDDFDKYGDKIKARLDMLVQKKIPLTAATLRKIQVPIPSDSEGKRRLVLQHVDDLISMSDGQVWFDSSNSHSPPVDAARSITRVGIGADTESRADAPAIRRIAEGVRLDLAQSASMEGAEATTASANQARKRQAWMLAMQQEAGATRLLSESCTVLLAASMGVLNDFVDDEDSNVITELMQHVQTRVPQVLQEIDDTFDIAAESQKELEESIRSYFI